MAGWRCWRFAGHRDTAALVEAHATAARRDLAAAVIEFETGMDGRQRLRRHSSEPGISRVQDLPPEDLRRFAFKMATGSGKTWVMAMAVVWSHFHKLAMPDSELSTNFSHPGAERDRVSETREGFRRQPDIPMSCR